MFSFRWVSGDQQQALTGTHKIVLSESTARKLFGNDWAENDQILGQTLEYVNEYDRFSLVVSGIIADAPPNSHIQYDFLASFATLSTGWAKDMIETWDGNGVYTYLQLASSADTGTFPQKIRDFIAEHGPEDLQQAAAIKLQPLPDIHLHAHGKHELKRNGNATYVSFFSIIALLILLIALLNYVNLTTARAIARGKEVGLRKAMGALRPQLIKQFLLESLLLNAFAFILAIALLQVAAPFYTLLMGKALDYHIADFWWFVLVLFPLSTLFSGFYPAFVLSGFQPIKALNGKLMYSPQGKQLRKGMVVFQFWVSIVLITFTFAVIRQVHHMRYSDPGFNREGVMVVEGPVNRTETWIEHDRQRDKKPTEDAFKGALSQRAGS